ncbi:hypothetical protein Tco_0590753 [Tanacetum coccineum]
MTSRRLFKHIKVSESAQDRDVGLGGAIQKLRKKESMKKVFQGHDCMELGEVGEVNQLMHTTMVFQKQVKIMKITGWKAGIQVLRRGELRKTNLSCWIHKASIAESNVFEAISSVSSSLAASRSFCDGNILVDIFMAHRSIHLLDHGILRAVMMRWRDKVRFRHLLEFGKIFE